MAALSILYPATDAEGRDNTPCWLSPVMPAAASVQKIKLNSEYYLFVCVGIFHVFTFSAIFHVRH